MPSLIAQRSLNNSTKLLNQAIERMTTGFKINHASDNAANFSITTNMNTKLSSYQVAEDNVAMGLDLLSTAGGSLDLISDKLTRLRALAEQSANGTYGEQSLKAINSEANAIVDEIERIYSTAEYNGIKLFGTSGGSFIQEVQQRDTSSMTKLSSVATTQTISTGTYSISTAEELAQLATMTNAGKVTGGEFVLANNIDLSGYSSGEGWTPIGNYTNRFSGTFDGNGYVVSNLYINRPNVDHQGLFGCVNNTEIKDLGVENVNVIGRDSASGLCGDSIGSIWDNCYVTGKVKGAICAAGLLSHSYDEVINCYAAVDVTGTNVIGCLIGAIEGIVTNSYAVGNVEGVNTVGGLCGWLVGTVDNSYAACSVKGNIKLGGLIASMRNGSSFVNNSYYNTRSNVPNDASKGVRVTANELNALIKNGTLPGLELKTTYVPNEINFQIGVNSDLSSQIILDTAFGLNLSSLRWIGMGYDYLNQIDSLINKVSSKQTDLGASENRFESALEEISTQYDNLVSSRSTLRDADIAEVSSEYIRQQILQQASATLMATANQSPALALQLL